MDIFSQQQNQSDLLFNPEDLHHHRLPNLLLGILAACSIGGFFTNLHGLYYILFNFSLTKSAFLILFLDALTCVIGMATVQGSVLSLWGTPMTRSYHEASCTLLGLGMVIPSQLAPFNLSLLSLTRLFVVKSRKDPEVTDKKNVKLVLTLMLLALIYLITTHYIVRFNEGFVGPIERYCVSGNYYQSGLKSQNISLIFKLPYILFLFLPLILDLISVRYVKTSILPSPNSSGNAQQNGQNIDLFTACLTGNQHLQNVSQIDPNTDQIYEDQCRVESSSNHEGIQSVERGGVPNDSQSAGQTEGEESNHQQAAKVLQDNAKRDERNRKDPLEIPVKATIISAILGITSLLCFILTGMEYTDKIVPYEVKVTFVPSVSVIMTAIRVPIIIKLTVRKNEINSAVSKSEERTRKQAAEIQYALQARERRRNNQCRDP